MEALKPATYADLLAVPDHLVAEIVRGSLYTSPRPAPRHANAAGVLGGELNMVWQRGRGGPGGWWILPEPELHLGDDILVPDIAGWRRERMERLPETAWFALRPDWVCEILSPSTARLDRGEKLDVYADRGVPWAWLVDPGARLVEVFELTGGRWTRHATARDETAAELPPFGAV
ncbi:MAG: Uma2 family endonuclease, partial [Myxococcales bacterium]|nr:Uma2 family endonuclease [Myxococcales bacterium]